MINYQKKKVLIHDGPEDPFLNDSVKITCPLCGGAIFFGLYNSLDFDMISEDKKNKMLEKMRGVKLAGDEIKEYKYKESPLRVIDRKCANGLHDITIVFTYKELQPSRYESYLIGVFDKKQF